MIKTHSKCIAASTFLSSKTEYISRKDDKYNFPPIIFLSNATNFNPTYFTSLFPVGYRVSKYCGEHLVIVNESPVPESTYHSQRSLPSTENDVEQADEDGPRAEALIQSDQMFHHLKILKPAPSEMQSEYQRPADNSDQMPYRKPRKGVYSQVCYFC